MQQQEIIIETRTQEVYYSQGTSQREQQHHRHHQAHDQKREHISQGLYQNHQTGHESVQGRDQSDDVEADAEEEADEDQAADQILQSILGRARQHQQNVYMFRQQETPSEQTTTDDSDDHTTTRVSYTTQTDVKRKRQQKAQAKTVNATEQHHCVGCQQTYVKVDREQGLCHNCIKMYQAIRRTIAANRGTYVYDQETTTFRITCGQGHSWIVKLEARKGRGWCRICSTNARRQHKEQVRRELERARYERAQEEQRLFQEAATQEIQIAEEEQKQDQRVQQVQQIMQFIEIREEHKIQAQAIEQLTQNIIQLDEQQVIEIIQMIAEEHRERVNRHIKSMLHPDKNRGVHATEAFQKYSNCSFKSKSKPPSLCPCSFMSQQHLLRSFVSQTISVTACAA